MKTFILLAIPFMVFASGETMSTFDHMSLHSSNHRPSIKIKKKIRLHRLHKINEEQAESLIKMLTQENSTALRLMHSGNYLIYKASTDHYKVVINALDGTVIKQELKEGM